jgi:hypothetical protein
MITDMKCIQNQKKLMESLKSRKRPDFSFEINQPSFTSNVDRVQNNQATELLTITSLDLYETNFIRFRHRETSEEIINRFVVSYGLEGNFQQVKAFRIIANHVLSVGNDNKNQKQLLLYLSGMAGTGKTHVIQVVIRLFDELNRRSELFLSATTGMAAVLIGGHTIHALTYLPKSARNV